MPQSRQVTHTLYEVTRRSHAEMEKALKEVYCREAGTVIHEVYPQPGARYTWRDNTPDGYLLISLYPSYDPCVSVIEVTGFLY